MTEFKTLAALFSRQRFAKFVSNYGPRYIAFVAVVLGLCAIAAAGSAAYSATEYRIIQRLQATGQVSEGKIVGLEIRSNHRKDTHQVWATYSFSDQDGNRHEATDYRFFRSPPELVKAQPIEVLYDPAAPESSRLLAGLVGRLDELKLGIEVGLFSFVLCGAFVGRYVQWRWSTGATGRLVAAKSRLA
jgi:hypothetical protein